MSQEKNQQNNLGIEHLHKQSEALALLYLQKKEYEPDVTPTQLAEDYYNAQGSIFSYLMNKTGR